MKNLPLLFGTLVATMLMIVGVAWWFGQSALDQAKPANPDVLLRSIRHQQGKNDAKVTVVEFSDFQCPACALSAPLVKQLITKYPDEVRVIFRHFPLKNLHPFAQQAAIMAETAGSFGKFWEAHDILFAHQDEWAKFPDQKTFSSWFATQLPQLSVDKTEFQARIQATQVQDLITQDINDGSALNLTGTPTFFVNGSRTPAQELFRTVDKLVRP